MVCQYYYPENFAITKIAESFVKRGHDVSVLTGKPNYGYGYILPGYQRVSYELINGVKVHRVDLYPRKKSTISLIKNYLSFWRNAKKWVKYSKHNYDIVYSYSLSPVTILSPGNLYKKIYKVPHVAHIVDIWPESVVATGYIKKHSLSYLLLKKWSKNIYQQVDTLIVGTPTYEDYFKNVLKIKHKKIVYIPQPSLLDEKADDPYMYKDGFNILYCGNISELQAAHLIVPAMKQLEDKNIYFHIVGSGRYASTLVKEIYRYNLHNKVILHGPKTSTDANNYFVNADACYVSLLGEWYVGQTIPNKLMAAMGFAKPIIAVLKGDGKEILKTTNGAVFAEENAIDIAKSILHLSLQDKEQLLKMGKRNYEYYKKHFALDEIVKQIELIFLSEEF